jgi:membrane associated rhomboid family serine protease
VGHGAGHRHAGREALSEPDATGLVRATPSRARADEWAVVLAAVDVACVVRETAAGWTVVVDPGDLGAARAALDAYDEENAQPSAPAPAAVSERALTLTGAYVALLLLAVFALSGGRAGGSQWFARGSADGDRILAGEWWRVVTAMTLHADAAHVLGNAVAAALLVSIVGQALGIGVGLALLLLAGAAANVLTAVVQRGGYVSVGASTAIFGAIGILAALRLATPERVRLGQRRRWVIGAAVLLLLVVFGTGAEVDVLGHLFGLLAGVGLGLLVAVLSRRPPGAPVQWLLGLATVAVVVGAWWRAFAG